MDSILRLDSRGVLWLNGMSGRWPALDALMIACARYAPEVFAVLLIVLWLSWRPAYQRAGFLAGAAALIALGIGQLVGMAFPRRRPYETFGAHIRLLVPHSPDTSFPSDHATLAFAITVALWAFDARLGIASLVFSLVVAVARVYIGAHYPTDVLGGAVVGAVVAAVVLWASTRSPVRSAIAWLLGGLSRAHLAARVDSDVAR